MPEETVYNEPDNYYIPEPSPIPPEIKTTLQDGIIIKNSKKSFDVWARDANNQKIDDDYVTVTNNDSDVEINWTDEVKTSYTAYLTEGTNNINVHVSYEGQELVS